MGKPDITWNALNSEENYSDVLDSILAWAKTIDSEDENNIHECTELLREFLHKVPPYFENLRSTAKNEHNRLTDALVDIHIAKIKTIREELEKQIRALEETTKKAKTKAKTLSLKDLQSAVDTAKAAVEVVKTIKDQLEGDDGGIGAKLESLLEGFSEVIEAIG